jgi:hypothetical protein
LHGEWQANVAHAQHTQDYVTLFVVAVGRCREQVMVKERASDDVSII